MAIFTHTATVRWSDCDANGHAANTAYSEYSVDTRLAFLAAGGWTYDDFVQARFGPIISREEIDYLKELRLGDQVAVDFTIIGGSPDEARFKFHHEFVRVRDGKLCARMVVVGGWMNLETRRLAPPPPRLAEVMRTLQRGQTWDVLPDAGQRKG